MSRVVYFDCPSGASGDMILGALVDAGVSIDALRAELATLPLGGWTLSAREVPHFSLIFLEQTHGVVFGVALKEHQAESVLARGQVHAGNIAFHEDSQLRGLELFARDVVEARGGRVVRVDLAEGFSTTNLIKKTPRADRQ